MAIYVYTFKSRFGSKFTRRYTVGKIEAQKQANKVVSSLGVTIDSCRIEERTYTDFDYDDFLNHLESREY
jgi:hypothetical protein